MSKLPVIVAVIALLLTGCMTGPIPIAASHADDNSINPSGPSEEKLPGGPAVRAATP
jgi:starvation-inducible outer membrane lipoprotein